MRGRDRHTRELRSVAPILVDGKLVAPVALVRSGGKIIGATDPELLRPYVGATLVVATMLDGSQTVPVGHWGLSRNSLLALVELAAPIEPGLDVRPLDLGTVCASVDTRGAPAALVGIVRDEQGFARSYVPVQVDRDSGAAPATAPWLASPIEDIHVGMAVEGASLFAWFPANPALGRASEVLVLGIAQAYRGFSKPRDHPVIAGLIGLDDLGRALLVSQKTEEHEPDLVQVAGEIPDRGEPPDRGGRKKR